MTATLSDPDGSVTGTSWQWLREEATNVFGRIPGATDDSYTPTSQDDGMRLRATATYNDGHGSGKSASATTNNGVAVDAQSLMDTYDADDSGIIEIEEARQAYTDYFEGRGISKEEAREVFTLYFES